MQPLIPETRMQATHWKTAGTTLMALAIPLLAVSANAAQPDSDSLNDSNSSTPIKLNVRLGLWEISSLNQLIGQPPISDDRLAKLTPEQRAQVQAALQSSIAEANKPHLAKHCVTPEKIARGFDIDKNTNQACTKKLLTNTATEMEIDEQCSDSEGSRTINEHFQFANPELMSGTVQASETAGGKSMRMSSSINGKWLSASCGDIKDVEIER